MAAHLSSRCLSLFLVLLLSMVSARTSAADGEFIYNGFSGNNLTMDGEASVADGVLRLTSGQAKRKGHAFYTYPLNFTNHAVPEGFSVPSFSRTFVFTILGAYLDLSGHGLAFVLSSTKELFNALPSQYLGLLSSWSNGNASNQLLAVELDTIQNSEFTDIDDNHVGVDINSLHSHISHTAGYYTSDGKFHQLDLISRKPMQVWVDYDSKTTVINVTIAPYSLADKPSRPLISVTYDLSTTLPTAQVYAGFSSATGTINSRHYVLGWSFKLNGEAPALNRSALSKTIEVLSHLVNTHPHRQKTILLWTVIGAVIIVAMVISAILVKVCMKRRSQERKAEQEWEREYGPPSFSYKDLFSATNGFKDQMLLGRGGFGGVFRGVLPHSKQTVAIKRVSPESKQGMKEFMAEIIILGHLRHRNLVQLLGYCRHKQQLLLVYDYMPNRSLDCFLHGQENTTTTTNGSGRLNWAQRLCIIKGVASGLLYLHEEWEQVIIHRDIKSSNVLLDDEMNARLGDFGLARSHEHGANAHTTRMGGTWGYIAPELARLGKVTKATDVFALGVLMMEVVCARRPIWVNATDGEPLALADWVLTAWRAGSITNAMDTGLLAVPVDGDGDHYEKEEAELVLKLGLLCSHPWPIARPCMRLVVQYLQGDAPLPADPHPDSLLMMRSEVLNQNNNMQDDQQAVSCPFTTITDLSKGR
jgi:hypothetical protein